MTAPDSTATVGVALEACPFCGGEAKLHGGDEVSWVQCRACGSHGQDFDEDGQAIAAWNRRAAVSAPATTGEVDDTYTDEAGTVWSRPTAWAYAAACKALWKHRDAAQPPSSGWEAGAEASPKLAYAPAYGDTLADMRKALSASPLYQHGDARLVWVNEGDFLMLALAGVKMVDLTKPLPPPPPPPPPSREG